MIRVYVWMLSAIGITTIAVMVLPRAKLTAWMAGVWFAVGGFGALVVIPAFLTFLIR